MRLPIFKTARDAAHAGYIPAHEGVVQVYRQRGRLRLYADDCRQSFFLTACLRDGDADGPTLFRSSESLTVQVWATRDLNSLGDHGCFYYLLEPERFGRAMRLGREAIDRELEKKI